MKILVCSTEYYPNGSGIANVAHNIVTELEKAGICCSICSPTGPDIVLGNKKCISKLGRLRLIYYWMEVSKYLHNVNGYDVVWLHQPLFLFKNPFDKCISTIHITALGHFNASKRLNYSFLFRIYLLISLLLEKYCIKKIRSKTNFVTDSPKVSQELIELLGNTEVPTYIPNGVDTKRFKPITNLEEIRKKFNVPQNCLVFVAVGRLAAQKKLFLMLDVFKNMQQNMSNCYLLIAGKGSLYKKLQDYISCKNISNVNMLGFVSDDDLPSLYACANYYIMTSEYEGQPLTLLEAISSGLPCIVSDIPNLKIVEDANCGIVVNFSDIEKATKLIVDYIKKDNSEHGINARKYAEEKLDWGIIANKYLDEFKKLER